MFSYNRGVPIAKIVGGTDDGKIIHLMDQSVDPIDRLSKDFKATYKDNLSVKEIKELHKALRMNDEPNNPKLKKIYKDAITDLKDEQAFDRLVLKKGKIQPLPRSNICEKLYVAGVSGSGKSTYTGKWLKEFRKMFSDHDLILFSSVIEDDALDKYEPVRVQIDETLITDPLSIHDLENSCVIMDDTNTIRQKPFRQAVEAVQAEIIEIGRHYNTRCIVTSHILQNYKQTRQILNESTSCTFFPKASGTVHIKNYLANYAGLERDQINRVLKLPSRWVTLYRTYPSYLVWERGICLLSEF